MKILNYVRFLILLIFLSCNGKADNVDSINKNSSESSYSYYNENSLEEDESTESYPDGTYCAEVEYYNPNTGTQSTYTLTVDVEDNEIIKINFPQGWLDDEHFNAELDEDGNAIFTSDVGYDYEVSIIGVENGCFDSVPSAKQCIGTTENVERCKHLTDNANGLCWRHNNQQTGNKEEDNGEEDSEE